MVLFASGWLGVRTNTSIKCCSGRLPLWASFIAVCKPSQCLIEIATASDGFEMKHPTLTIVTIQNKVPNDLKEKTKAQSLV